MIKQNGFLVTQESNALISWKIYQRDENAEKEVMLQFGTEKINKDKILQIFVHSDLEELIMLLSVLKEEIDPSKQLKLF